MKTIRLFSVPSHATKDRTSGVDFARIIQPTKALNGWTNGEVTIETTVYDPNEKTHTDWRKVAKQFDLVFFNYTANPWAFAAMGAMCRANGVPMVLDLDDNLFGITQDNPAYEVYKKGSEGLRNFTAIMNEVDHVTCTNSYLRNVICHNTTKTHDQVTVLDNYIDLDLYKYTPPFKDNGHITLTHFGSTTHFVDLQNRNFVEGIRRIMRDFPNVDFLTVGSFVPSFRNNWAQRYQNEFGHADLFTWVNDKFPGVMEKTDLCVVPLENLPYTRCKSAIKFLEMSSAKKPGVWQNIRQYQNVIDGENGLLADSADEWYEALKSLILDTEKRRKMGEAAYQSIVDNYQMKHNVDGYAKLFLDIVGNKS
jgi:glycosyltransferase involved in cell wall biosynthesis